MKKAIAVLGLCVSLLPAVALADEVDDFADTLMKVVPSKCFEEAGAITSSHMRSVLPDLLLDGMREAKKYGVAWGPGNENYRQARDLLEMALQDEEVSNGPLMDMSYRRFLRGIAAKWTPAQRVEYLAFLKQKGGRVFWDVMVDGAICGGVIEAALKPPHALPEGPEKTRLAALAKDAENLYTTIEAELGKVPKDQRAKTERLGPPMGDLLKEVFRSYGSDWFPRTTRAADTVLPEVKKIVNAYKP